MIETKWCVLTGGPSSGITSLGNFLRFQGLAVMPECARALIDWGISSGQSTDSIRSDQVEFERNIIKLQNQVESRQDPNHLLFLERGLLDCEAYGLERQEILPLHQFRYQHIFLLEQIGYVHDYARTESHATSLRLEQSIEQIYLDLGYSVLRIPKAPIQQRAQLIFKHLGKTLSPLC